MATSDKQVRICQRIEATRASLGALMDKRSAVTKDIKDRYLPYEFGMQSKGPFMTRYLFLVGKLAVLHLALAFARPTLKRHDRG